MWARTLSMLLNIQHSTCTINLRTHFVLVLAWKKKKPFPLSLCVVLWLFDLMVPTKGKWENLMHKLQSGNKKFKQKWTRDDLIHRVYCMIHNAANARICTERCALQSLNYVVCVSTTRIYEYGMEWHSRNSISRITRTKYGVNT